MCRYPKVIFWFDDDQIRIIKIWNVTCNNYKMGYNSYS